MPAEVVFFICYIVYLLSMFLIYEVGLLEYVYKDLVCFATVLFMTCVFYFAM